MNGASTEEGKANSAKAFPEEVMPDLKSKKKRRIKQRGVRGEFGSWNNLCQGSWGRQVFVWGPGYVRREGS